MRLIFAGTPAVAVPSLRALHDSEHEVAAVLTRPDAPLGRKRTLTPSPVAQEAAELGIPVLKADRVDAEITARVVELSVELGVIVAYGALLVEPALSTPERGWINLHFSLLPRWRGAAPVQHALIAGDELTGMSVFQLVRELDAGPVFAQRQHPIDEYSTAGQLLDQLADAGAPFLCGVVDAIARGEMQAAPQRGEITLAPKLSFTDGLLDWHRPAEELLRRVRGVTPEPGAHTVLGGERFKIHQAEQARDAAPLAAGQLHVDSGRVLVGTGSAPLRLVTVQPAGKRAMPAADWWRGAVASLTTDAGGVVFE